MMDGGMMIKILPSEFMKSTNGDEKEGCSFVNFINSLGKPLPCPARVQLPSHHSAVNHSAKTLFPPIRKFHTFAGQQAVAKSAGGKPRKCAEMKYIHFV